MRSCNNQMHLHQDITRNTQVSRNYRTTNPRNAPKHWQSFLLPVKYTNKHLSFRKKNKWAKSTFRKSRSNEKQKRNWWQSMVASGAAVTQAQVFRRRLHGSYSKIPATGTASHLTASCVLQNRHQIKANKCTPYLGRNLIAEAVSRVS